MSEVPAASTAAGKVLIESTTVLLIIAGRMVQRRLDAELVRHGLTVRHLSALAHLAHTPELSYTDLARRSDVTVQSMHATIGALIDAGAITHDAGGRGRAAHLRVTPHGMRLLESAADAVRDLDAEVHEGGTDLDAAQLHPFLLHLIGTSNRRTSPQ